MLQRVLIEKVGNDHGFDYVFSGDEAGVYLASASRGGEPTFPSRQWALESVGLGTIYCNVRFDVRTR